MVKPSFLLLQSAFSLVEPPEPAFFPGALMADPPVASSEDAIRHQKKGFNQ